MITSLSADAEKQMTEFRDVMLDFVRMERDLKQFQEAVEFVKSQVGIMVIIIHPPPTHSHRHTHTSVFQMRLKQMYPFPMDICVGGTLNLSALIQYAMFICCHRS